MSNTKTENIQVRVTLEQKRLIEDRAQALELSVADYVRLVALHCEVNLRLVREFISRDREDDMKITIDIDDLLEFYEQEGGPDVGDIDDWIDRLESDGYETAEVAKMILVATELGLVQDGILSSHKLRLISGTRAEVHQKISQMKTEGE